ncbi:SprT family zinc-dependent metalloprotease [uncultured Cetobacterium sp.]|uniref:M48 family metallopeptidase n=1 Tax=uncultured Cetobacterium sp. TaxID=527638 RepID=UPI002631A965|nr:SprT family zinc-dependent metalloprotease [uncultured Cetobacterium sp.]
MTYNIIITKKKIKNLILKVKADGQILLSVPYATPKDYIESFIKSKENWIDESLKKIKKFSPKQVDKSYKNGDNIEYLGKMYILKIFQNKKNQVQLVENYIYIQTNRESDEKNIKNLLYYWYREQASTIFFNSLKKYSQIIGEDFNELKIRKMKNRWGSCRYLKKVITLNLELIKKPLECIDYVSLHEVAHLKYPHHKKEFWNFIHIYMPDWKLRKERLEKNE